MKLIEIIPLALIKIGQRQIAIEWVRETVSFPDQIVDGYAGRKVRQKFYEVNGKKCLLRAIVDETEDKFFVITAYLSSRIERYTGGPK